MNLKDSTMKNIVTKVSLIGAVVFGIVANSPAQVITRTVSTNYAVNIAIPDNDISGIASTKAFGGLTLPFETNVFDLNVTLNITGDYNGDLYAYLTHNTGFSVLLNRVGKTTANPLGYSDDGINVKFDDQSTGRDVHNYRVTLSGNATTPLTGPLSGTWLPDARNTNPDTVLDTTARTALLNSFNGLNPNGTWTLFVADLSAGGTSTLVSWGLEVTVPEPGTIALFVLGAIGMVGLSRRSQKKA
jgi:subtilisin-like proprotein convertase family protein